MKHDHEISPEYVRDVLIYTSDDGLFRWRNRPIEHFTSPRVWAMWNTKYAGALAGSLESRGYLQITLGRRLRMAHRLVWAYVHDRWPVGELDHINGDRADNRIANLREAPSGENSWNHAVRRDSSTGVTGVSYHKDTGKFAAYIGEGGGLRHLGLFLTVEDAVRARKQAEAETFGAWARSTSGVAA